jgi:CheY-like chemotaxis protein
MMKKKPGHSHHSKGVIIDETGSKRSDQNRLHRRKKQNNAAANALLHPIHFDNAVEILFVEDNVFNQELACFILNKLGCKSDIANSGTEAIEIVRSKQYDLILMDINMPGIDGYETTRILREKLLTEIPIIAFTTNVLEEEIQKCLHAGMNDHLAKPYTEQQLSWMIYKWTSEIYDL